MRSEEQLVDLPAGYATILADLKDQIRAARLKAGLAVNRELVLLYWRIGRQILEQQRLEGWGSKVIDRLSLDLMREFPEMKGFSPRNLKYMRRFAEIYPDESIVQELLAQITWYHNITILDKVKGPVTDFDPVRARAEGRAPAGMDAETTALFPDGFEETVMGMVPRGWRVGSFDESLILQRGFDLPSDQRVHGPHQVISTSGPSGCHVEYKVEGPGVTTGRSGLLDKVFFIHENFWPLNTSLLVKDFRVSQPHHAYFLLKNLSTETHNAGSAVPTLNRNHIHKLPVIVPTKYVIDLFEKLAKPIFNKIMTNQSQSNTLAAIRDRLLPELLSGKLQSKKSVYIIV
jgi:type I restriction enzyme S subunit